MKRKIRVDQLRLGMHVDRFQGRWLDHPFWRSNFALDSPRDLQRIVESGAAEVWIDERKGLALETPSLPHAPLLPDPVRKPTIEEVPTHDQALHKAAQLCKRALPTVTALFHEARLGGAIDVAACTALVEDITASVTQHPGALISVARLKQRDSYTFLHSVAVCALMVSLARRLGLSEEVTRAAGLAGMMHDVGKALVPLEILNKPGRLLEAEYVQMKHHPELGHELLRASGIACEEALDVCLHHHEKIDGSGYPKGLAGDQISLLSRMAAVCDVYDAITSTRVYKEAWDPAEALRRMTGWHGHFDPQIFREFVLCVGIYPVGSLIRLESGRLAVVTAQNWQALAAPRVKVFYSTRSQMRMPPEMLDLARHGCRDRIVAIESPQAWGFKDLDTLSLTSA